MTKKIKEVLHIYVRCSQDNQIENSISRQVESGINFSKEMNMDYKVWSDEGKSGIKSFENTREKFTELMWEMELGMIKHLWCEDFSRLTRNYEDGVKIETIVIHNDLKVYEGLLNNQIYNPNETVQRIVKVLGTIIGTDQKKMEIQKSIDSKLRLFKQGEYVRGNVSFGFKKKKKHLVIHKEESKWVKKIFEWCSQGKSRTEIQKELKCYGILSKRGNQFSDRSVSVLLRNIEYTGKTYYTDMTKDPHRKNPTKYPYPDETKWEVHMNENLPRIISDELFNKVQKKLNRGKPRTSKNIYFLHGKIKCRCGCDWVGRTTSIKNKWNPEGERYSHYICSNSDRFYHRNRLGREHLHKENVCDKPKRLPSEKLDTMVWENFIGTLRKSSFIKEKVKQNYLGTKYDTQSSRKMVNSNLKDIHKELKSLEQSRVNLLKEKYLLDLSDMDFKEIESSINQKISEVKSRLNKERHLETLLDKRSEWIDWIGQHENDVKEYEKITDIKHRRKVIDIFVDKIIVDYNKETQQHDIQMEFKYPIVNDSIEYTRDKNSKVKWNKWGNSYKVKKGNRLISLSDFMGSTSFVGKGHSTVTDFPMSTKQDNLIPFITFILRHKSHQLVHRKVLSNSHQKIHNLIHNMKSEGLGYRKISKELNRRNIKSQQGKDFYPSLVSMIWKKVEKKQNILNQPITTELTNFGIGFFETST